MTQLLVSAASIEEALITLECGADLIDLKNPAAGALGALPLSVLQEVVRLVARRRPLSATIGDLPMQPASVAEAAAKTAAVGVDMVKIGFFGQSGHLACLDALARLTAQGVKLVAVLFADTKPPLYLLEAFARAGIHGVMLDTCHKDGRCLKDYMSAQELREFVCQARAQHLVCGLAGSLRMADLPALAELEADYLGLRGGLCAASARHNALQPALVKRASCLLHKNNSLGLTIN